MTTIRNPNSLKYVARRFIDILGAEECARQLCVTEATIYALSCPTKPNQVLNVAQAVKLDAAVARQRGTPANTPFLEWACQQVVQQMGEGQAAPVRDLQGEMLELMGAGGTLANTVHAATEATGPGGGKLTATECHRIVQDAERVIEQATDVRRLAAAQLSGVGV